MKMSISVLCVKHFYLIFFRINRLLSRYIMKFKTYECCKKSKSEHLMSSYLYQSVLDVYYTIYSEDISKNSMILGSTGLNVLIRLHTFSDRNFPNLFSFSFWMMYYVSEKTWTFNRHILVHLRIIRPLRLWMNEWITNFIIMATVTRTSRPLH